MSSNQPFSSPEKLTQTSQGISRRALIAVGLAIPFLQATRKAFAASPSASLSPLAEADFSRLSAIVIGENAQDPELSAAIYRAFSTTRADFLPRAAALLNAIRQQNLITPAAFSSSSLVSDPVMKATAIALTASWYLGHTGDDDHPGPVVAYEKALMWIPTKDVMVVPGYSRGGPDYWSVTENPAGQ